MTLRSASANVYVCAKKHCAIAPNGLVIPAKGLELLLKAWSFQCPRLPNQMLKRARWKDFVSLRDGDDLTFHIDIVPMILTSIGVDLSRESWRHIRGLVSSHLGETVTTTPAAGGFAEARIVRECVSSQSGETGESTVPGSSSESVRELTYPHLGESTTTTDAVSESCVVPFVSNPPPSGAIVEQQLRQLVRLRVDAYNAKKRAKYWKHKARRKTKSSLTYANKFRIGICAWAVINGLLPSVVSRSQSKGHWLQYLLQKSEL